MRFGKRTQYCLVDIDISSPYHPDHNPLAIRRLISALEPLGLNTYVACRSSDSGGLHLYFPFESPQYSWKLAAAITALLQNHGFKLSPGQLEVFPNPKPYVVDGYPTLYNAHRLPMQPGFWLLNAEFEPIWGDHSTFVQRWQFAETRNDLSEIALERVLKQAKRPSYCVSNRAEKFLNDLNAEIEKGWTGYGQTNRLLGRIALRTYVFHPVITGGPPLTGQALVNQVVETAQSLPGYREWCRHQHEIVDRAEEWVRCVENSHYFPYGRSQKASGSTSSKQSNPIQADTLTWNQKQSSAARTRIDNAVKCLRASNTLPAGITDRFRVLTQFGISGSSLYRHRDLWHPENLKSLDLEPVNFEDKSQQPKDLKGRRATSIERDAKNQLKNNLRNESRKDLKKDPKNDLGIDLKPDLNSDPKVDRKSDPESDAAPDPKTNLTKAATGSYPRDPTNYRSLRRQIKLVGHPDPPSSLKCYTSLLLANGCNVRYGEDCQLSLCIRSSLVACNATVLVPFAVSEVKAKDSVGGSTSCQRSSKDER